ncbi:hypothetical protein FS763_26600 [Agrobacterium vitis]|nr:hypothetical protein [Allorhizobium ampelinum]MVA74408.1 hypothetical protein [Agrobacterium vitis]
MSKPKLWITVAAIAAVVATSPAFADTVIITHDKPAEKKDPPPPPPPPPPPECGIPPAPPCPPTPPPPPKN